MATAAGSVPSVTPSTVITDEQRRWVVIGICLNKLLTPVIRTVLAKEILLWYNNLCVSPKPIHKQTYKKHAMTFPPSTITLNYGNINKNHDNHKSRYSAYDYNIKDPESLARLFVQPFMAKFSGFDQTMDLSAALALLCEANPFHTSGAAAQANTVRSVVRNEWAHCDFSHWSDVNYLACLQHIESLVKKLNLSSADENEFVNELNNWKDKGVQLCCGQAVDPDLLRTIKTEVAELYDSVAIWREENEDAQMQLMQSLESVQQFFKKEIQSLQEIQSVMGKDIEKLKVEQEYLSTKYDTTSQQLQALENQVAKLAIENQEVPYLFMLPDRTEWFSGRESELDNLHKLFQISDDINESKVQIASVCGLGGSGKTSLAAEYAHRWKDEYEGGVFWFSGEDEAKFATSVDKHAVYFGTLLEASSGRTLVKTLDVISKIQKPWLLVLDDMDEYKLCSNIGMLLSGPWKRNVRGSGHILITTRRKTKVMSETIRGFKESQCLQLECFSLEDGKRFVFKRTGISSNEVTCSEAACLVETLEGLPLALEQACAYISHLSCSLSIYLQQYKQYSIHLLKDQEASPVSLYESPERLAVHTTWLLNFDYIKQSAHGKFAVRFLNACAFFNPSEIQKELINPGKPAIDDDSYRNYVATPLGSLHILKLLTEFSLFKESRSSLAVHRLVQEVIRDNFQPEEYVLSFVDAVRFLCYGFSCSRSPDDLLTGIIDKNHDRASLQATDPSFFHEWHKMCLHAHEIRKLLLSFLKLSQVLDQRIVIPQTARLVYECALHLNVNSMAAEAKEVVDFAYKIIRLGNTSLTKDDLVSLFPHEIPLPELVRRVISYSCIAPHVATVLSSVGENVEILPVSDLKEQGNDYYKDRCFQKAVEKYTYAMNSTDGKSSYDPTLLSNRASAFVELEKFDDALRDAEEYISLRPKCCKGYAKKALALYGLKRLWDAACVAALAYYYERNIFGGFKPFSENHFFQSLKDRIYICSANMSSLVASILHPNSYSQEKRDLPRKIVILEAGNYTLQKQLRICDCIMIGVGDGATASSPLLSFQGRNGIISSGCINAENISLAFDNGHWESTDDCDATFLNCSFTDSPD
ncbi:Stress-induced-phospho 1 [Paramuricea clavata]|uniref:Stress-induced-phospho 1 n=1 Tax=Paramuricea clavata TaxID=317549 RepID=A0A7D9IVW5_PARCT|nr:Stress-induced-phospho 1 [Paramuricea clavata]